ncbi:carboxypeptidase regulatory-like domain-containing protein [Flavobacterium psychroterrae]|uniref:Carboxypeptidase regulatory-like domain-containing protein n=1 Tax=Flavobacterium psychroterrae TaxID=2133767 RepID=A0ABS5P9R4_9FLAO|nr:carboxypeptidase regulatory-like domain-containing protein [Flavobacterium psychroterrae]MBS7231012.1 carboxypeptidase regulatory-like domain-containing protein [Flavobacterium psychroterrae]
MKYLYKITSILFLLFLVSCSEEKLGESSFGTVTGRVVNADTFQPMENVKILSSPTTSTVFTDVDGKFTVSNVKVGEYSFQAQKDGFVAKFEATTVTINNTSEVVFELKKATANNKPPTVPVLVSPVDNSTAQAISLDLTWTDTDPDNDELIFKITLRNATNSDVKVYNVIKEKKLTLTDLLYNTKYYWQIEVTDGVNTPVLSTISTFTTLAFPATRFLFVKNINDNNVIFTADDAGKQYQLTSSDKNYWRPRRNNQAKKIAFIGTSGSQNDLYTMNYDGTGVKRITSSVPIAGFNSDYVGYSWNASGSEFIYPNFDKLYKISSDGSGLTKIFQTPNGKFISECDWSADGTKIALKVNDANGYNVEVYVINPSGIVIATVLSGRNGAVGGLNFSITGQKLVYTKDLSGFENVNYRQLDSRIFEYSFASGLSTQVITEKISGTNDLDVRYSPNESELIFTNTSNDGISIKNTVKTTVGLSNSRTVLFSGTSMSDWE